MERHRTRHKRDEFGADAMKRWWDYSSPLGHELETLIPESSSLDDTLETITKVTSLGLKAGHNLRTAPSRQFSYLANILFGIVLVSGVEYATQKVMDNFAAAQPEPDLTIRRPK